MAEALLSTGYHYFSDPTVGRPVFFGSIYIGIAGLDPKIESNRVNVTIQQESGNKVVIAPASQPFITSAGGQILYQGSPVVVLVNDAVSVRVDNKAGVQVNYNPNYNDLSQSGNQLSNDGAKLINGSFEIESAANVPSNWTLNKGANGNISTDSTTSDNGVKSLLFSSIDATGGGTAVSDKINVSKGTDISIVFTYKSSSASTLNAVSVRYYDISDSVLTTNVLYTEGANNPTVFTTFTLTDTAPASAVRLEIILTGVDGGGTTVLGTTSFDNILFNNNTLSSSGLVILTEDVPNSVSRFKFKSAATGDNPTLDVDGEPVGIDIEGVTLKNTNVTSATATHTNIRSIAGTDLNLVPDVGQIVTINSTPVYSINYLGTPLSVITGAVTDTGGAWQAVTHPSIPSSTDGFILKVIVTLIAPSGIPNGTNSANVYIKPAPNGSAVVQSRLEAITSIQRDNPVDGTANDVDIKYMSFFGEGSTQFSYASTFSLQTGASATVDVYVMAYLRSS